MSLLDNLPVGKSDIAVNALEIIGTILKDVTKDPLSAIKLARSVYHRFEAALQDGASADEIRQELKGLHAAVASGHDLVDDAIDKKFR